MPEQNIPDEVRRFILTSIPSVPYLESILLLQRETSSAWNAARLAERIYVPQAHAAFLLRSLEAARISAKEPGVQDGYRYAPPPQLAAMLERVAQHYATDLFAVTALIHSSPEKRAYQFADAFRLRKDS
jgi:hypothetical protein